MDYTGLVQGYPLNRPLTEVEICLQMHKDRPSGDQPWAMFTVIKMNSTYLECVDRFFKWKGENSAEGLTFPAMLVIFTLWFIVLTIVEWPDHTPESNREAIYALLAVLAMNALLIFVCWSRLKSELFRFTHYPIRFNRKNRMVYATRMDGTVMAESWDKLFFAEGQCRNDVFGNIRDIRGHRLAEDGKTVLDTFALPYFADIRFPYRFCVWEFIRRYMEEGPEKVSRRVEIVNKVSDRRETYFRGLWHQVHNMFPSGRGVFLGIILLPGALWYSIGRWFAMQTSKIPRWPAEIEAECQIDPDDPYIIDGNNPPVEKDDPYDPKNWVSTEGNSELERKLAQNNKLIAENQKWMEESRKRMEESDKRMEASREKSLDLELEEAVKRMQEIGRRTGYYKREKANKPEKKGKRAKR